MAPPAAAIWLGCGSISSSSTRSCRCKLDTAYSRMACSRTAVTRAVASHENCPHPCSRTRCPAVPMPAMSTRPCCRRSTVGVSHGLQLQACTSIIPATISLQSGISKLRCSQVKVDNIAKKLNEIGIPSVDFLVSKWFLCCFFGVLPAETVRAPTFTSCTLPPHLIHCALCSSL